MRTFRETLNNYLAGPNGRESDLAEKIGCSQAAVNRYRNGKRFPDADVARLIDEHTSGAVPFAVWHAEFLSRSGIAA